MAEGLTADTTIFRCTVHMRLNQQLLQTGFHLRSSIINPLGGAAEANTHAGTWFTTILRQVLPVSLQFVRHEALEITSKDFAQTELVGVAGAAGSGTISSTGLAVAVAIKSAKRARTKNGRMFWPSAFAPVADLFNTADMQALQDVATNLQDRYVGATLTHPWRLVVVSPPRPAVGNTAPRVGSWIDAEVVKVNRVASYLRSRKVGVGS
jgi:hypothetical protein